MNFLSHLLEFLRRSVKDPSYAVYFLRNYRLIRTRFPRVASFLRMRSRWGRLCEKKGGSVYSRLHVIIRSTDAVVNVNSSRALECMGIVTKHDVIRAGAKTVFEAAARFCREHSSDCLKLTIVTDRMTETGRSLYREFSCQTSLDCEFVESAPGNAATFRRQIELALEDSDDTLVAIFEDDYACAQDVFLEVYDLFNRTNGLLGFNPHFHPNLIAEHEPVRLYKLCGKLYQSVLTTCCTFFIGACDIRKYKRSFLRYEGWENASINDVWRKGICLSPCGRTLAEHLHRSDLSPVFIFPPIESQTKTP